MALTRWDFETGSDGNAITAANTGASSVVVSGGAGIISTARAADGTRSARLTSSTTSGGLYYQRTGLSTAALAQDVCLYLTAAPSGTVTLIWFGSSSTRRISLNMTSARILQFVDAGGATAWTSPTAVPLNQWVRLSVYATQNATTGTMRAAFYPSPTSTTATEDSTLLTGKNTGASAYTDIRVGMKCTTGVRTGTGHFDINGWDPAATGLIQVSVSGSVAATAPTSTLTAVAPTVAGIIAGSVAAVLMSITAAAVAPTVDGESVVFGGGPPNITVTAVAPTVTGSGLATVSAVAPSITAASVTPTVSGQQITTVTATSSSITAASPAPAVAGIRNMSVVAVAAGITLGAIAPVVSASGNAGVTAVAPSSTVTAIAPTAMAVRNATVTGVSAAATGTARPPTVAGIRNSTTVAALVSIVATIVAPTVAAAGVITIDGAHVTKATHSGAYAIAGTQVATASSHNKRVTRAERHTQYHQTGRP